MTMPIIFNNDLQHVDITFHPKLNEICIPYVLKSET